MNDPSLSERFFLVYDNDRLFRIPSTKRSSMMWNPTAYPIPRFKGKRVRTATVTVELHNRRPVKVLGMAYSYDQYDDGGLLDFDFKDRRLADAMANRPGARWQPTADVMPLWRG